MPTPTKPRAIAPAPVREVRRMALRLLAGTENATARRAIVAAAEAQARDLAAGTYPRALRPWLMHVAKTDAIATCAQRAALVEINEAWTAAASRHVWTA